MAGPEHTAIDGGMQDAVVKFWNGETRRAVLDGFTLTNGSAWEGGGVSIGNSGPTIRNNIIKNNLGKTTGGVFCGGDSSLIVNNIIINNRAIFPVTVGAGIGCEDSCAEILGNYIAHNRARGENPVRGGGIGMKSSHVRIANNMIMHNEVNGQSYSNGGGICCDWGSYAVIENNLVSFNISNPGVGGGISLMWGEAEILNTTFYENSSTGGGAEINVGAVDQSTATNCIIWNTSSTPVNASNGINFIYCDIIGGWPGIGNIDEDPMFVDPAANNFTLMQEPCQPGCRSPCIDAGSGFVEDLGFQNGSTRSDHKPDVEIVDLGFHYGPFKPDGQYQDFAHRYNKNEARQIGH